MVGATKYTLQEGGKVGTEVEMLGSTATGLDFWVA
jgi:hypothetical protein